MARRTPRGSSGDAGGLVIAIMRAGPRNASVSRKRMSRYIFLARLVGQAGGETPFRVLIGGQQEGQIDSSHINPAAVANAGPGAEKRLLAVRIRSCPSG
jgi:hypothetical protein